MKVTVTKNGAIVLADVEFSQEEWEEAQKKATLKLAKDITVPGFRKGNAPYDRVKDLVNPQKVMETAIDSLLPKGYKQILEENKDLEIMIQPLVDINKVTATELSIKYTITVKPEVKLGQYRDIQIMKITAPVTDDEINHELSHIQEQCAEIKEKEDGIIAKGNLVNFDFEGFVDGKPFDGGKAEKYDLEIGSNRFVPGFEDQMVGMKKGEKGKVVIKFPEDYVKDLAGKEATFHVTINNVSEKNLPEVNDDLALDANIENVNTLDELKAHLIDKLTKQKEYDANNKAFDQLVDTIVANAEVEIPETLVTNEVEHELEHYKQDIARQGIPYDKYLEITGLTEEKIKEQMKEGAEKNLKVMFVLNQIAIENELKVTDADIDGELNEMATRYNMPLERVKEAMKDRMNELVNQIYSRKITDFVREANSIV